MRQTTAKLWYIEHRTKARSQSMQTLTNMNYPTDTMEVPGLFCGIQLA